ncbi:MAG: hypothetical protein GX181_09940 [Synergistaceae bacterium]|nr:hypothetical protein [Synergistota bacterium]NLM72260.1 hypothetical protein [Synergistaceae bacterium]
MKDKGLVVCGEDIDEGLSLQVWTKGACPRLVVVNRGKDKRKLMPFRWLEKEDRTITLKGAKGKSNAYNVEQLEEPVRRMLYRYAQDPVFKGLLWHSVIFMSDLLHTPRAIFDETDFAMLHDDRRCRLWLLDLTEGERHGFFLPFFPRSSDEEIFGEHPGAYSDGGRTVVDLKKSGVTRKLASVAPARWYDAPRIAAAAALLGFSLFYEDASALSAFLWNAVQDGVPSKDALSEKPDDPGLSRFTRKMANYVRHWYIVDEIEYWTHFDSFQALKDKGFTRKQRVTLNVGDIGPVEYTVTIYADETGRMAVGCSPVQYTDRHQGDMIFTLPAELYEKALEDDSFGGAKDDYFTLSALISAKLFSMWKERVGSFVNVFLSPGV